MSTRRTAKLEPLVESDAIRQAARVLIQAVQDEGAQRALTPKAYTQAIRELERLRGQPLVYPTIASGLGRGARVWLADGTQKLDFTGGIGVLGLGHGEADLLETAVVAAASDVVFQDHLMPGPEYLRLTRALLRHVGPHLKHVWLSLSGAMANENALKMIFQRHAPADRIIAFDRCFHGRTLAMAELTDRPAFRQNLPLRGNALYIPFFDPEQEDSTERSLAALETHLRRYPNAVAGMCFELVQGEGGFRTAPREFFAALMARCQRARIAVWVDEVQSFARTGELYAYRTLDLEDYVNVVTVGKILQGSAVLFSKPYNPKPGLLAGTYAGNTVGMAVGARIIERLENESYLGPEGRIAVLDRRIAKRFESLEKRLPHAVGARSGMGAMQAFVPFDGSVEVAKALLEATFEEGLVVLPTGTDPTKIRLLPPLNATDEELEACFTILEKAMRRVAESRKLSC
jgi:4-aminobutyrate aminotransferase-like enzyme